MHPLEEEVTLPDGRVVKVHGKLATDWRKAQREGWPNTFLRALANLVDESK
jgi:hypothetical protein